MKKISFMMLCAVLLMGLSTAGAVAQTTIDYGDYTLYANGDTTHWNDVWDLTQGDLTLSYTIDMSGITQPHGLPADPDEWEAYIGPTAKDPPNYPNWYTPWVEVGLRGEDAGDFNPGPFGVYQGNCGGWMVSESDDWVGFWDGDVFNGDGTETQDLDDKHGLQASGGRSELDYDVLLADPDTVNSVPNPYPWYPGPLKGAYGSWNNHGLWFDRDGVDEWQATSWGNSGENAGRINTGGIYNIVITYHAIDANGNGDKTDDGLGVMFATINGVQQGFYTTWVNGPPQDYPAGLSFKGDMQHMQVFAGSWAGYPAGWDYGTVELSDITVTGYLGTSDPLVADFTYTILSGYTFQFTDATSGGMPPYTYGWDFNNDGVVDSTDQNPTWTYGTAGEYDVKLTVTPFRCVPKSVTETITVESPGTGTPGYWMNHPEAWPVDGITIGSEDYTKAEAIELMKHSSSKDVTYTMFQALVAAKLNVLIGNDASCIETTIADADAWMTAHGPVGSGVKAGGKDSPWRDGEPLYLELDDYNNGLLCAPSRDLIIG